MLKKDLFMNFKKKGCKLIIKTFLTFPNTVMWTQQGLTKVFYWQILEFLFGPCYAFVSEKSSLSPDI